MSPIRTATFATGFVTAVALLATGCGGDSDTSADNSRVTSSAGPKESVTAETDKVTVGSVGFGQDPQYGGAMAVATVTNPTSDGVQVTVSFAAYDDSGTVLDTESAGAIMRSSSEQILTTDLSVPENTTIARVDAQVSIDDKSKDEHPESTMEIEKVDVLKKYGSFTGTGVINSHYESTVSNVYVGISCTNAAGSIVGGGYTFTDSNVVGGATTPFSVSLTVSEPPAKCDGTATLSNLSEAS